MHNQAATRNKASPPACGWELRDDDRCGKPILFPERTYERETMTGTRDGSVKVRRVYDIPDTTDGYRVAADSTDWRASVCLLA
jgi:hypothetical protein